MNSNSTHGIFCFLLAFTVFASICLESCIAPEIGKEGMPCKGDGDCGKRNICSFEKVCIKGCRSDDECKYLGEKHICTTFTCVDDCSGLECGPSPTVGFNCGTCAGEMDYCTSDGVCEDNCKNRECGFSPNAGYDCGTCDDGKWCLDGNCSIESVLIGSGIYSMGCEDGDEDEIPVQSVSIQTFEIMKTEVTIVLFRRCVEAGACETPSSSVGCNWGKSEREDHPVNCVDWYQASAFCEWAGGRLPSEAEWEYAARSEGQNITYPWGDQEATCQFAVMFEYDGGNGCGTNSTWPICSKAEGSTEQGLCDMAGNVQEWVEDWYHDSYEGAPSNGSAWNSPEGALRVLRGGSWGDDPGSLRTSNRNRSNPTYWHFYSGFRCARGAAR